MGNILPRLVIIGLAASVSPVAVMVLASVLSRNNARRNSLIWLLGFASTLIALGVVVVYLFHVGGSGGTSKVDGYIDIALGALCLLLIPWSLLKRQKEQGPKVEHDLNAFGALSLGCVSMAVNSSTLVIFISGLHVISKARLAAYESALAVATLTIFTLITVLIPMAIYFIFPVKSEKLLASLKTWLTKHKKVIGIGILLIFGIYLLEKGIRAVM
jgi:hypothetical protein